MKTLNANIPTSLGDLINLKAALDNVKNQYSDINLTFHKQLWKSCLKLDAIQQLGWLKYLDDISHLFFQEPPYHIGVGQFPFYDTLHLLQHFSIPPVRPNLSTILSKGIPLCPDPYIVLTTKVRGLDLRTTGAKLPQLWEVLKSLPYKIVILGERHVEMRKEYEVPELRDRIWGLYSAAMAALPSDQIIDLSVPGLGNTPSQIQKMQQDCFTMAGGAATIVLGCGGNLAMANGSGSRTIGYSQNNSWFDRALYGTPDERAFVVSHWNQFLEKLKSL